MLVRGASPEGCAALDQRPNGPCGLFGCAVDVLAVGRARSIRQERRVPVCGRLDRVGELLGRLVVSRAESGDARLERALDLRVGPTQLGIARLLVEAHP